MKFVLLGYGGMGQTLARIARERGHELVVVDPRSEEADCGAVSDVAFDDVDCVIDFSLGEAVEENVRVCREAGVNIVVGSTGWYERMDAVKELAEGIGFMWSSNFSIGVNMYFKIVREAAKLVNKFEEYDVWGSEIHHFNKADSPSGTAKSLIEILLEEVDRKEKVVEDKLERKIEPEELHFASVRAGAVNFSHTIGIDSAADKILLTHEARNRDGYALGAVKAAEWMVGKKGYFEMNDFLNF